MKDSGKILAIIHLVCFVMSIAGIILIILNTTILKSNDWIMLITLIFVACCAIGSIVTYLKMQYNLGGWWLSDFYGMYELFRLIILYCVTIGIFGIITAIKILANKV